MTYRYKGANEIRSGFIAQELQKTLPELVTSDANGNLSIDVFGLFPHIVSSLQTIQTLLSNYSDERFHEMNVRTDYAIETVNKVNEKLYSIERTHEEQKEGVKSLLDIKEKCTLFHCFLLLYIYIIHLYFIRHFSI